HRTARRLGRRREGWDRIELRQAEQRRPRARRARARLVEQRGAKQAARRSARLDRSQPARAWTTFALVELATRAGAERLESQGREVDVFVVVVLALGLGSRRARRGCDRLAGRG